MPVAAVVGASIGAAGALGSAGLGLFGSLTASQQQQSSLKQALALQQQMFGTVQNAEQPFISGGQGALSTLTGLLTPGPNQTSLLSQLPGFQFAQNWGQQAVQNLGTTTGLGGNVLTSGANFATGLAQQGFSGLAGLLQNVVNSGVSAGGVLGNAAGSFGQTEGNTLSGIGQAQAAGTLGATNALSSGISGGTNAFTNSLLLSKLFGNASNNPSASTNPGIYSGTPYMSINQPQTGSISDNYIQ